MFACNMGDSKPEQLSEKPNLRMSAYYYSFDHTGDFCVDKILSAIACAGKGFHHTESWEDELGYEVETFKGKSYIEWIQNAAIDTAKELQELRTQLEKAEKVIGFYSNHENWFDNELIGKTSSIVSRDEQAGDEFGESKHLCVGGKLARRYFIEKADCK